MNVELIGVTPNAEELIEKAARTCYQSREKGGPRTAGKMIRMLVSSGHHSVLEHAYATFRISGCSRAMTHQLVRHRLMAISQESQRYCDEKGMFDRGYFVEPRAVEDMADVKLRDLFEEGTPLLFDGNTTVGEAYSSWIKEADNHYQFLQKIIKAGREKELTTANANEDARFLLPNACISEIVISANFRELRHIFTVRCDARAQWEIRRVSMLMLGKMKEVAPNVFDDFVVSGGKRGYDGTATTIWPS